MHIILSRRSWIWAVERTPGGKAPSPCRGMVQTFYENGELEARTAIKQNNTHRTKKQNKTKQKKQKQNKNRTKQTLHIISQGA